MARRHDRQGQPLAIVAAVVGGVYALVSAYWALGGRWLLDTVGGEFERLAAHPGVGVTLGVWGVVLLKLIACALPLASTSGRLHDQRLRVLRPLVLVEAAVLTLYGLVFSSAGWLVQARLITSGRRADQDAETWHAFLWDPWFLVWGLLVCATLRLSRPARQNSAA